MSFGFILLQDQHSGQIWNWMSYYSTDEQALREILTNDNVVDWSRVFVIGG